MVELSSMPSDFLVEEVLQSMKDGIDKNEYIRPIYNPIKASVRNKKKFWTSIPDEKLHRIRKLSRKKQALNDGFFTEPSKPYRTMGTVYLNNGEMILSALTDDFRAKLAPMHTPKRDSLEKTRKSRLDARKPPIQIEEKSEIDLKRNNGIKTIKKRLEEIGEMRRLVLAEQSLMSYLVKKEAEMNAKVVEDPFRLIMPTDRNWAVVFDSLGSTVALNKATENSNMSMANVVIKTLLKKSKWRRPISGEKSFVGHDLDEMELHEMLLKEYKFQKKITRFRDKVKAINSLLCAVFNLRTKYIRLKQRLSFKLVLDLLRSDVTVDDTGKPMPKWKKQTANPSVDGYSESSRLSDPSIDVSLKQKKISSGQTNLGGSTNKPSKQRVTQTTRSRVSDSATKKEHLDSWEDFLNAGEKVVKVVTNSPSIPRFSRPKRHQTIFQLAVDHQAPWQTIPQTEKAIQLRKSVIFPKSCEPKYRTPTEVLNDVKREFKKLKTKLDKEVEEECQQERLKQLKSMKCKYDSIQIGPPIYDALPQMREAARLKLQDRTIHAPEASQWFVELEAEAEQAQANKDQGVIEALKKVARFQYENHKSITFAKEKICLLVMSMPAYLLLAPPMIDALIYILGKMLRSHSDMLDYWLTGRKLEEVGIMQKYI